MQRRVEEFKKLPAEVAEYSQGVGAYGPVLLKDGIALGIDDAIEEMERLAQYAEYLRREVLELQETVSCLQESLEMAI